MDLRTYSDTYCTFFLIATYLTILGGTTYMPFVLKHIYDKFLLVSSFIKKTSLKVSGI